MDRVRKVGKDEIRIYYDGELPDSIVVKTSAGLRFGVERLDNSISGETSIFVDTSKAAPVVNNQTLYAFMEELKALLEY